MGRVRTTTRTLQAIALELADELELGLESVVPFPPPLAVAGLAVPGIVGSTRYREEQ